MYLDAPETERSLPRQGDIISQVHITGAINLAEVLHCASAQAKDRPSSWTVPHSPEYADAMVLSHSCEIAPENGVKLTSIILAPLRDVHKATDPTKVAEIVGSNFIDKTQARASYLKYFYLEPNERLAYARGAVVDFSKCFSVRKGCYADLVSKKVLQLKPDVADSMALKLALYFHREQTANAEQLAM
jgi:hypothetical protein